MKVLGLRVGGSTSSLPSHAATSRAAAHVQRPGCTMPLVDARVMPRSGELSPVRGVETPRVAPRKAIAFRARPWAFARPGLDSRGTSPTTAWP
jgi:hypothetical protein